MAVALILGLAVGVNTGFFGVVNALLLRPIPGVDSSGLANLYVTRDGQRDGFSGFSHPTFGDLCERSRSFGDLEAFAGRAFAVGDETATSVVTGQLVSGGFFRLWERGPRGADCLAPRTIVRTLRRWPSSATRCGISGSPGAKTSSAPPCASPVIP
jgi:hypothetical protein